MTKLLRVVIAVVVTSGCGAWDKAYGAEPAGIGRVNLTLAQYQTAVKEMQDYRPASLSVYRVKGETLYTALWQRGGQIPWKETLNRTLKEFEADSKTMQDDEFRPLSLHVLVIDGQPRYFVIWKKLDGEFYYFRDRMTADTFRKFSSDYAERDIYPTSVGGYEVRGQMQFAAVWEQTRPGSVEYQVGLTEAALAQKSKGLQAKGFYPQFLSGYSSRGKPLYTAIWVQQEGVEVEAAPALSETDWQKRSAELEKKGYDLMSLQGTAVAGKARFSAVWRKVKELPEDGAAAPK